MSDRGKRPDRRGGFQLPSPSERKRLEKKRREERLKGKDIKTSQVPGPKFDTEVTRIGNAKAKAEAEPKGRKPREHYTGQLTKFITQGKLVSPMQFATFLLRHGIYASQPHARTINAMKTRSFKLDLISYLKEPTTKQTEFNDAYNFIDFMEYMDNEIKPGVTFRETFTAIAARKRLNISNPDDENGDDDQGQAGPSGGQSSQQGSGHTGPGTGSGEQPPSDMPEPSSQQPAATEQDTEVPENQTEQPEETNTTRDEGGQETTEHQDHSPETDDEKYQRYKGTEGQGFTYHKPGSQKAGRPLNPDEERHLTRIKERFDADTSPLNPNYIFPSEREMQGRINAQAETWKQYFDQHKSLGFSLINEYIRVGLSQHHYIEGRNIHSSITRTKRIELAIDGEYAVKSMARAIKDYGGVPPPIPYD